MARKKEEGNSKGLTVVLIILIVLLMCALLLLAKVYDVELPFVSEKKNDFEQALSENNYQAAYTIFAENEKSKTEQEILEKHLEEFFILCESEEYTKDVWTDFRGLEVFNDDIQQMVLKQMDEVVARYYSGEISEENAKNYISRISNFSFTDSKYDECTEYIKLKDFSEKAYLQGVNLYIEGKFEEAVKSFKDVNEKDALRYPLAQDAIETIKNVWGKMQLEEAQKMIDVYNKEGAREVLENVINVFGSYEEAQQMILKLEPEIEE